MIYLNNVEEGGETDFPNIQHRFTPAKRMAVVWKNSDGSGKEYSDSLHAGLPVKQGKKITFYLSECNIFLKLLNYKNFTFYSKNKKGTKNRILVIEIIIFILIENSHKW